jgi:hypothetical protein
MPQHISGFDTNTDNSGQQPNHAVGPGLRVLLQSFLTSYLDLPDLAHTARIPGSGCPARSPVAAMTAGEEHGR